MYTVTFRNPGDLFETELYTDDSSNESVKIEKIDLKLSVNSAGSLSMTLPYVNAGYSKLERLVSTVKVWRNDTSDRKKKIWEGRVISDGLDFWKNRNIVCEGELAYLNDTIQPPNVYRELTVEDFLQQLIDNHNERADEYHQFYLGVVTVENETLVYRYTNYETTLECIENKLLERYGGVLYISYDAYGNRYLNYLDDYPSLCTQTIEFGKNLLDINKYWDLFDFATVIIPLGARLDPLMVENDCLYRGTDNKIYVDNNLTQVATASEVEDAFIGNPVIAVADNYYVKPLSFKYGDDDIVRLTYVTKSGTSALIRTLSSKEDYFPVLDEYLTIAEVNDGSIFLVNQAAVNMYGRIEKVVNFDDITVAENLLEKGQEYLTDIQFDQVNIELTAFDLHYANVEVQSIFLFDKVRVISLPHELDKIFYVTELSIPLNKPESASISLSGIIEGQKGNLTDITSGNTKTIKNISGKT